LPWLSEQKETKETKKKRRREEEEEMAVLVDRCVTQSAMPH
jgi:hypothetical protein